MAVNIEKKVIDFLLEEDPDIELIYFFGSIVSGKTHPNSDIDIAFWSYNSTISNLTRFLIQEKLAALFAMDIDLVDMRRSSEVFCFEVVTTGKRIYTRNAEQMQVIENTIWNDYIYLNEIRREIVNDKYGRTVI